MRFYRHVILICLCLLIPSTCFARGNPISKGGTQQNIVYVESAGDFPAPSEGVITLADGTHYVLTEDVSVASQLSFTGSKVIITSIGFKILTYTGNSIFLIGSPYQVRLEDLIISGDQTNQFINFTFPGTFPDELALFRGMNIENFDTIGTISGASVDFGSLQILLCGQGFTLANNNFLNIVSMACQVWLNQADAVFISGTGTTPSISLSNVVMFPQSNESIFNWDSGLVTSGKVLNSTLSTTAGGSVFASGSQDQTNVQWSYNGTNEVPNSTVRSRSILNGNSAETTIAGTDTPVAINGIWTNGLQDERMIFQDPCTFDGSTDKITTTYAHGFSTNDVISFWTENSGTLPTNLSISTDYYIITDTSTTYQVSATSGGGAIDFTGNGTADQYFRHLAGNNKTVMIYTGLEDIALNYHGGLNYEGVDAAASSYDAMIMKRSTTGVFTETIEGDIASPTNARPQSGGFRNIIELSTNEGVALYIESHESTKNVIISDGVIIASKI